MKVNVRHISPSLYLIAILCVALIIRLISLNQSFWLDEAAQAIISQNPFAPGHFNGDFQPPLFYYLTHFWMKLGTAEWFLRLPSVFFGVATVFIVPGILKGKKGVLAAAFLATAPFHVYYSQEFRMYSMLTFLTALSWYLLQRERRTSFAIISLAAIFTHYFALVNLAVQLIYLARYNRPFLKKLIIPLELVALVFTFWLPTLIQQIHTSQTLTAAWPTWASVSNAGFFRFPGLTLAKFTVGMISPPKILYGAAVGIFGLMCLIGFKTKNRFLIFMALGPLILAWIAGMWIPATSPWRVQFVLPAIYMLIAQKFYTRKVVVVYLLAANLFFTGWYLFNPKFHREDWRAAVAYTDSQSGPVLAEYTAPFAPMQWYTTKPEKYIGGSTEQKMTAESVATRFSTLNSKEVTVYSYLFEISDPERLIEKYLATHDYSLTQERDFRGVGIVRTYMQE